MPNPMDQVVSKGKGLAHEAKARMSGGLVGVFATLSQQHGEAAALLERAKADAGKRAELWPTIRATLRAHEQGELFEVYPALRPYPALTPFVDRHETEANELSATIDQMNAVAPESPPFAVLLDKLIGLVQAHVTEEETEIFPKSQQVIGDERARELEPNFLAAAKRIKQADLSPTEH